MKNQGGREAPKHFFASLSDTMPSEVIDCMVEGYGIPIEDDSCLEGFRSSVQGVADACARGRMRVPVGKSDNDLYAGLFTWIRLAYCEGWFSDDDYVLLLIAIYALCFPSSFALLHSQVKARCYN
jgi:hypothetical protein